jgi:DNA-binding NarL/FixJ family response regulator
MSTRKLKVIIVDDSEFCRESARLNLEDAGFEVITLGSPIGFSQKLLETTPSIALVDFSMPGLKGDQLVQIARRAIKSTSCPIVLFSDQPERTLSHLAKSCGADGYICKSDDWPAIIRSIQSFISRPRHTALP